MNSVNPSRRKQNSTAAGNVSSDPSRNDAPPQTSAASGGLRTQPLQEKITRAARDLWQRYGSPAGRDEEIWLEAERQVLGTDPEIARVEGGSVSAENLREAGSAALKPPSAAHPSSPGGTKPPTRRRSV